MDYYVGIDVGGTKIQGAIYDGHTIYLSKKVPTPKEYNQFLEEVRLIFHELITGINVQDVKSIGMGIPGTVINNEIKWVPNIPHLHENNVAQDLKVMLNIPVYIANDAQLALLGESWKGAAKNVKSAILVSVGTGVGGAIMVDQKIVQGRNGSAGSFGWINLDFTEESNPNHGYLERHASGKTLEEIGNDFSPPITPYELIKKAELNERVSVLIVESVAHKLGVSLAMLSSILEPELVIFSGGLSETYSLMENKITKAIQDYASPSTRDTPVVVSSLGTLSGVYGAVCLSQSPELMGF